MDEDVKKNQNENIKKTPDGGINRNPGEDTKKTAGRAGGGASELTGRLYLLPEDEEAEETEFKLGRSSLIGRSSGTAAVDIDLSACGNLISHRHARITYEDDGYYITNLSENHSVHVNSKVVVKGQKVKLTSGDGIILSKKVQLQFEDVGPRKWNRIEQEDQQVFTRISDNKEQRFTAPLTVGEGRYEIYDILSAAGGFGIIYKARDRRLRGHEVLIKCRRYDGEPGLFSHKGDTSREGNIEKIREKTQFEANCLTMFKQNRECRMPILNDVVFDWSPSIHGPHRDEDTGEEYYVEGDYVDDEPYIVMQVINGTNLGDYVRRGPKKICEERGYKCFYEWEKDVLGYAKELASIFDGFHKPRNDGSGDYYYIYQDLKPDNIILSQDRFITLLDFGGITKIKLKTRNGADGRPEKYAETGKGSPGLGTFGFQAPEARNPALLKNLDKRCDIYTLGATMYQLLTGFDYTEILETPDSEIPLERSLKGVCSEATYKVIEKCLERDREKRYGNMREVRTDIVKNCFTGVKEKIRQYY